MGSLSGVREVQKHNQAEHERDCVRCMRLPVYVCVCELLIKKCNLKDDGFLVICLVSFLQVRLVRHLALGHVCKHSMHLEHFINVLFTEEKGSTARHAHRAATNVRFPTHNNRAIPPLSSPPPPPPLHATARKVGFAVHFLPPRNDFVLEAGNLKSLPALSLPHNGNVCEPLLCHGLSYTC